MTNIETRPLGHSGIQVSVIGLGCNQFGGRLDLEGTRAVLDGAISEGITFLDTADRYGNTRSEEFIGEVLKGRRDEVVLATKFGMDLGDGWTGPRGAPDYISHAVENSLQAPADRRDRRVLVPPARRRHADRRHARGPRRAGQGRHRPRDRRVELRRGADRGGRRGRPRARPDAASPRSRTSTACCTARPRPRCCRSASG